MGVVEGRSTTEIWTDDQKKPHTFEWQRGSMFSIPLNTWHRIVNASSSPAMILVATTAPNVMNIFRETDWIFNCPVAFPERFDGNADFFKPKDDIKPDPLRGLAMSKSNLIPDIMNGKLYLDNRRSPGYLRVEPSMANNVFYGFIGEHETGRYSKAHAHMSSAVLVCLKGKGYTYTWPRTDGMTPWKDGKTQNIYRQDYEPVGIVTAAPYGGDWFHAHFGISKEPLRLIGWYGPNNHRKDKAGVPGEKDTDEGAIDVTEGGTAIPYWLEDPFLRQEYEETLRKEGVKSKMEEELYHPPVAAPALAATMNLSRRAFLVAGACASSVLGLKVARAQGGIWQEYRRDDVGFRIEMPGEPRIRLEKGDPQDTWTTSTNAQVRYQHEIFDVSWTEFKGIASVEEEYTRFREMMARAGYQIEDDIQLTLNEVPAREFIIETGNINFVRRILAVRNFAIGIQAMGARNIHYSRTARRFLGSFRLLRT